MLIEAIKKCLVAILLTITACIVYVIVWAFAYALERVKQK